MKRAISLAIPLLVLLAVLVTVLAGETGFPSGAQLALSKYVVYENGLVVASLEVRARQPWNFSPDMSAATFGESARYRTDNFGGSRSSGHAAFRLDPTAQLLYSANDDGRMPLPFPPQEVWCVPVARKYQTTYTRDVIFVAYHQDIYNGAWIVHALRSDLSAAELTESLSRVGCDLTLEP